MARFAAGVGAAQAARQRVPAGETQPTVGEREVLVDRVAGGDGGGRATGKRVAHLRRREVGFGKIAPQPGEDRRRIGRAHEPPELELREPLVEEGLRGGGDHAEAPDGAWDAAGGDEPVRIDEIAVVGVFAVDVLKGAHEGVVRAKRSKP